VAAFELALITCEHGGHRIPKGYAPYFEGATHVLRSHRGWDAGALEMAEFLSHAFRVPLLASTNTRLLVDLNRSEDNPEVFSEFTRTLGAMQRQNLLDDYHLPHRASVLRFLRQRTRRVATQVHIASHSFAPVWKGKTRSCDIGLLYDPSRSKESHFVRRWRAALCEQLPALRIRLNQPYRGWTDGLATRLREELPSSRYVGIELEINQKLVVGRAWESQDVQRKLALALQQTFDVLG